MVAAGPHNITDNRGQKRDPHDETDRCREPRGKLIRVDHDDTSGQIRRPEVMVVSEVLMSTYAGFVK